MYISTFIISSVEIIFTWSNVPLYCKLNPAGQSCQFVFLAMVQQVRVQRQRACVGQGRGEILWEVEETEGDGVPSEMRPWRVGETDEKAESTARPQKPASHRNLEEGKVEYYCKLCFIPGILISLHDFNTRYWFLLFHILRNLYLLLKLCAKCVWKKCKWCFMSARRTSVKVHYCSITAWSVLVVIRLWMSQTYIFLEILTQHPPISFGILTRGRLIMLNCHLLMPLCLASANGNIIKRPLSESQKVLVQFSSLGLFPFIEEHPKTVNFRNNLSKNKNVTKG